jgi:WD40 repeat protein
LIPTDAYIWDVDNPNRPDTVLSNQFHATVTSLAYNHRSPDHLIAGGLSNGMVAIWDAKKGGNAQHESAIESSHGDPVVDVVWTQTRSASFCNSLSDCFLLLTHLLLFSLSFFFLSSFFLNRTHGEFCSIATDGNFMFWDVRALKRIVFLLSFLFFVVPLSFLNPFLFLF